MQRVLITAVDSVLGANLALVLADRYEVAGLCRTCDVTIDDVHVRAGRLAEGRERAALTALRPDWIIHPLALGTGSWDLAAATADLDADDEAANATAARSLAEQCGAALTVISSDAVFAGPWLFHDERSSASATSVWAARLRELEAACGPGACVVRTHAYGWSPLAHRAGLVEQLYEALCAGSQLAPDGCRHATPILATDLAVLIEAAFQRGLTGLFHAGGAERCSPYQVAVSLATVLGVPAPRIVAAAERTTPGVDRDETSLSSRRLRGALGLPLPLLGEGLERFVAQRASGWCERWHTTAARYTEQAA